MALPQIDELNLTSTLDGLYNEDSEARDELRANWGLTGLTLTREQLEEAIWALRTGMGVSLVSSSYRQQAHDFIEVFNAYSAYMNA